MPTFKKHGYKNNFAALKGKDNKGYFYMLSNYVNVNQTSSYKVRIGHDIFD